MKRCIMKLCIAVATVYKYGGLNLHLIDEFTDRSLMVEVSPN